MRHPVPPQDEHRDVDDAEHREQQQRRGAAQDGDDPGVGGEGDVGDEARAMTVVRAIAAQASGGELETRDRNGGRTPLVAMP